MGARNNRGSTSRGPAPRPSDHRSHSRTEFTAATTHTCICLLSSSAFMASPPLEKYSPRLVSGCAQPCRQCPARKPAPAENHLRVMHS